MNFCINLCYGQITQSALVNIKNPIILFDCTLFLCRNFQHASRHVPKFSGFSSKPRAARAKDSILSGSLAV